MSGGRSCLPSAEHQAHGGLVFLSFTSSIMGEYAIRKSDGVSIKIGTCESMYYLRFEDRHKVKGYTFKPEYGLSFRLPFPDEDFVPPGEYDEYDRGTTLTAWDDTNRDRYEALLTDLQENTGTLQLRHQPSGLMLNVPCYHGLKLPEVQPPMRAFWNGKDPWPLKLVRVKWTEDGLRALIACRFCGELWSTDEWDTILPLVQDDELRHRLKRAIATAQEECHAKA